MSTTFDRKVSFSHFGVSCLDVPKMTEFYTSVMGMIVSDQGSLGPFDIVFLTTDPTDHHQFVLASGRKDPDVDMSPVAGGEIGARIFQMSFRMKDLATMRAMVERFRAAGIETFTGLNHGNAWAVYTRDIEGNPIELFVDSPWAVAQPCGFPLDFSKTDDEIYAETEAYCLAQPECEARPTWEAKQAAKLAAAQASI